MKRSIRSGIVVVSIVILGSGVAYIFLQKSTLGRECPVPNAERAIGFNALLHEVEKGNSPAAVEAVENGLFVDTVNGCNVGLLFVAAVTGDIELARFLIEHGANVNSQNWDGNSPLTAAVTAHRTQVARLLLENGADPNHQITSPNAVLITPLFLAVANNLGVTVGDLLTHGADPCFKSRAGDDITTIVKKFEQVDPNTRVRILEAAKAQCAFD